MHLGPAHDDAVGPFFDDTQIQVRVGLFRRTERAVALGVGLSQGEADVLGTTIVVERLDPFGIRRAQLSVHLSGRPHQAEQGVTADHFGEHDQGAALPRRGFDQLTALEELVGVLRGQEIAAHLLSGVGIGYDGQVTKLRIVHQPIVGRLVVYGSLNERMPGHVRDPFAPEIDEAVVLQTVFVLLDRT